MAKVDYKGLHKVKSKGRTYYYAWRGGPRIEGEPGTAAFHRSYMEAVETVRAPDPDRFNAVIVDYKRSQFPSLAKSTQSVWGPWLDRIGEYFGKLRTAQFDRPAKIRPVIRRWRSRYKDTPRAADVGMQVLSRVLSHAVELGSIGSNPCEGIKPLYAQSRAAIIWTESDIAQLKKSCTPEIAHAVDLAAYTGLRVSDLIRLSWNHIQEEAIVTTTGKSNHRREAVIPLYGALRDVLARIPKRSPTVLTNSRHQPWTRDGLGSSFNKAKIEAGISERDLHFHDFRGTAATKFYRAGLSLRLIAEIMAWEEEHVERIIRRYVTRDAAIRDAIEQLDGADRDVAKASVNHEEKFVVDPLVRSHAIEAAEKGGCVYFARSPRSGRVKIGYAHSALTRMVELATGSPEQLILGAVMHGGRDTESQLHLWFKDQRAKGEWFDEDPILLDLIAAVASDPLLDWKAWLEDRNTRNIYPLERE